MAMHFNDMSNSVARQIYLTFPAESTFKDEDVAAYFRLTISVQLVLDEDYASCRFIWKNQIKQSLLTCYFLCVYEAFSEQCKMCGSHTNKSVCLALFHLPILRL